MWRWKEQWKKKKETSGHVSTPSSHFLFQMNCLPTVNRIKYLWRHFLHINNSCIWNITSPEVLKVWCPFYNAGPSYSSQNVIFSFTFIFFFCLWLLLRPFIWLRKIHSWNTLRDQVLLLPGCWHQSPEKLFLFLKASLLEATGWARWPAPKKSI